MPKLYIFIMAITGFATVVSIIPNLALYLTLRTFGAGVIFMVLSTNIFIYGLCLVPGVLYKHRHTWVLSGILLLLLGFGPGLASYWWVKHAQAQASSKDLIPDDEVIKPLDVLDLVIPESDNGNIAQFTSGGSTYCGAHCMQLLESEQIRAVRLVNDGEPYETADVLVWSNGTAVFANGQFGKGNMTIQFKRWTGRTSWGEGWENLWVEPVGKQQTIVSSGAASELDSAPVIYRRTSLQFRGLRLISIFTPDFGGLTSGGNDGGLYLSRIRLHKSNTFTTGQVFEALGFSDLSSPTPRQDELPRWRVRKIREEQRSREARTQAESILLGDGISLNTPARESAVRDWLVSSGGDKGWDATDQEMFERLYDIERTRFSRQILVVASREPEVVGVLLPDLLPVDTGPKWGMLGSDSYIVPSRWKLNDTLRAEYRPRLKLLLDKSLNENPYAIDYRLVAAASNFDLDPDPYILGWELKPTFVGTRYWTRAVCKLPFERRAAYMPFLLEQMKSIWTASAGKTQSGLDSDIRRSLLRMLFANGYEEEVRQLIDIVHNFPEHDKKRILAPIAEALRNSSKLARYGC